MIAVIIFGKTGRRLKEWEGILLRVEDYCYETLFLPAYYFDARLVVQASPGSKRQLNQARIHTGFHRFMEIGQIVQIYSETP